jgi:hypothetical protein
MKRRPPAAVGIGLSCIACSTSCAGDVVVVWKLDRLSRSLKDLLHILEKIDTAAANFRSLTEAIDTSGPAGRMMMQMLGSFAEFERAMGCRADSAACGRISSVRALSMGLPVVAGC